jgi:hypothetical protein
MSKDHGMIIVSNKPVLPTAPDQPNADPLHSPRRHIGRPFGSFDERQAAAWQRARPRTAKSNRSTADTRARGR